MAYPRLDIVDPLDSDAVLWSFNDRAGATNPYGLRSRLGPVRFGVQNEAADFQPANAPGGVNTSYRDALWRSSLLFYVDAVDEDSLSAGLDELSVMLVRDGVMIYQKTASSEVRYIDYLKSPRFALLRGQHLYDLARDPEGIPIEFSQQPGLRGARLEPGVNLWSNASMLADSNGDGTPDGWTLEAGTHLIAGEAFRISHGSAVDLLRRDHTVAAATQVTFSVEARKVSGTRAVEVQLISRASDTLLDTAVISGAAWARYEVSGAVTGGDTGVRVRIRYVGGSGTTVAEFRDAQLETGTLVATDFRVGVGAVSNDPSAAGGRSLVLVNSGKMIAPFEVTLQAESGDTPRIEEFLIGLRASDGLGHRSLAEFLNTTRWAPLDATANGWTVTLEANTSVVADAGGSGGNVAECSFATNPTIYARRVRISRTTLLDSMRGYHDVYLRHKTTDAGDFRVQMKWAPSLADPAPYGGDEVQLDHLDAGLFDYSDVYVGTIYISEIASHELGGVALEFWARRDSGTGSLRFATATFVPSDPLARDVISLLSVPGSSRESWRGNELVTPTEPAGLSAGANKNNRKRLNAVNEAAGTPPVGGLGWPAGRHRVQFWIDGKGRMDFIARVRNITDSNDAVSKTWTDRKPSRVKAGRALEFDSVAGKSYEPQVLISGGISAGEYLDIIRIRHQFTPYLGASEQMHTDPSNGLLEKLDAAGNVVSNLGLEGPMPLWVPPGRHMVTVIPRDIRVHSGAPHLRSILARDLTFSAAHAPRYPTG